MLFGGSAGLLIYRAFVELPTGWRAVGILVCTLPAAVDFVAHELAAWYQSSTCSRLATGTVFGFAVGVTTASALHGQRWLLIGLLMYLGFLEVVIAAIFKATGHLDTYIQRYELGVYKGEEEASNQASHRTADIDPNH